MISDRAYTELRDRIVTARLPPGTLLREDALMRELGVGRTPLREAVKRLALENLVAVQPRSGTYVTSVDAADIVHISEVRAELEAQAAELAARRLDGALRSRAEALLRELRAPADDPRGDLRGDLRAPADNLRAPADNLRAPADNLRAPEGGDPQALMRLDESIHRLVWDASGNPYLAETLERYFVLSLRVWYVVLERVGGLGAAVLDHARLLEAILDRDPDRARTLMREHVNEFEREIVAAFGGG